MEKLKIYDVVYTDRKSNLFVTKFEGWDEIDVKEQFDYFNMYEEYRLLDINFVRYSTIIECANYLASKGYYDEL